MSTFSDELSAYVKMSKKEKRLESKKKKALAFLSLLESKKDAEDELTDSSPPVKRICRDYDVHGNSSVTDSSESSSPGDPHLKGALTDDAEYARAKQVLKAHQKWAEYDAQHGKNEQSSKKSLKNGPSFKLTLKSLLPFSNFDDDVTVEYIKDKMPPLFVVDLQHLILLALLKECSFWMPRWCRLLRPRKLSSVVLVVLKAVSITDFEEHADSFPFLKSRSQNCVEMVTPAQYNSTVDQDLRVIPLSISQMKRYTKRKDVREGIIKLISKPKESGQGSKELSGSGFGEVSSSVANSVQCTEENGEDNMKEEGEIDDDEEEDEQFPRTSLLLSTQEMVEEGYPMPVDTKNKRYAGYVFSKDKYIQPKPTSPMFSVDCEMCQTCTSEFELTRVSILDEQKQVVYDQLVKPYNKITNYLTRYSGMTEELLEPVTKRLAGVQKDIRNLLPPDAILCGQSLWNDLCALKMFHPYVIDTSVIFNQSGDKKVKCGLRKLTYNFLGRTIQDSDKGHCSVEDAKATMDLVKLKLQKGIEFGDAKLGGVYFPDIQTYFNKPSQAQNVEETFSSCPTLADLENFPRSKHTQSKTKDSQRKSVSCVQSPHEDSSACKMDDEAHDEHTAERKSEKRKSQTAKIGRESEEEMCGEERTAGEAEDKATVEQHTERKEMSQKEIFFQQEGSSIGFSFFEVVTDSKSTVGLVGDEDLVDKFPSQQCVAAEDENDVCAKALEMSRDKDFTWLELRTFADLLASEQKSCGEGDVQSQDEKRKDAMMKLVSATVMSRLDYCNLTFIGIPGDQIVPLQRVQNSAARAYFLNLMSKCNTSCGNCKKEP